MPVKKTARKTTAKKGMKWKKFTYMSKGVKKTYRRQVPVGARRRKPRVIHYAPTVEEVESVVLSQPAYFRRVLARV